MLGGHYDSWHDATGATDNGIGSSMMLEAVRHFSGAACKAAPDDSRGAVERRRRRVAGVARLCAAAFRKL